MVAEAKYKETLSMIREEAADRITALGRALSTHEPVSLTINGKTITLDVSEPLVFELEAKVGDQKDALEVELKWSTSDKGDPDVA
jgi:amphi-Trp domain-containing protein